MQLQNYNIFEQIIGNRIIWASFASWGIAQTIKILSGVLKERRFDFKWLMMTGGMPSAHTAAAASMALATGLREGLDSSIFAVALVLTAVVAHDAVKVRGSINTIINILRKVVPPEVLEKEGALPDTVGHSVREVAAGFVLAAAVATGCHLLLP